MQKSTRKKMNMMVVTALSLTKKLETGHLGKRWNSTFSVRKRFLFQAQSSISLQLWGYGAFILMSLLSASFYPVAKPMLDRIDTAIFVAVQMAWLIPPAFFLLAWSRWRVSWKAVLRGVLLGSCMSVALLCLTLAMAYTSITETTMFSCVNGILVVLILWFLFRHPVHLLTWLACLCSMAGIVVLLSVSDMHWTGDLLAFVGGLLLTGYSFLVERLCFRPSQPKEDHSRLAVFGVQCLTMAGEMLIYALLFGNWQSVHMVLPKDLPTFAYVGLVTTLLPMATMMVIRPHVNGVLLTFLATLEPIAGAVFAFFFAHEHFLPLVYLGGALAVSSIVFQALANSIGSSHSTRNIWRNRHLSRKEITIQKDDGREHLPVNPFWPRGRRAYMLLVQLWSTPEGLDLLTLQRLTGIPCGCAHRLLAFLQKQGYVVSYYSSHKVKYYMLHPSWRVSHCLQRDFRPAELARFISLIAA
jgi:drug/metabolite transporter (DMT)-like permease